MLKWWYITWLLMSSGRLFAATIAVCEPLVAGDPHLSLRITRDYQEASQLALQHFSADHPGSNHQIKWCLEVAEPLQLLKKSITPDVTAFVGFTFTGESKIAADFADHERVTYLSPVAALDELFDAKYGSSLGLPMTRTGEIAAKFVHQSYPGRSVHLFYPRDSAYARFQSRHFKQAVGGETMDHGYMQVEEGIQEILSLESGEAPVVFLAGYAHQHFKTIKRLLATKADPVFLATNQWAYSQELLRSVLEKSPLVQLYVVSNFTSVVDDLDALALPADLKDIFRAAADRSLRFSADFQQQFKRSPPAFSYAAYDTVYLALAALDESQSREKFHERVGNLGWFAGAAGPVYIHNGVFRRPGYLLKWTKDRLKPIQVFP